MLDLSVNLNMTQRLPKFMYVYMENVLYLRTHGYCPAVNNYLNSIAIYIYFITTVTSKQHGENLHYKFQISTMSMFNGKRIDESPIK